MIDDDHSDGDYEDESISVIYPHPLSLSLRLVGRDKLESELEVRLSFLNWLSILPSTHPYVSHDSSYDYVSHDYLCLTGFIADHPLWDLFPHERTQEWHTGQVRWHDDEGRDEGLYNDDDDDDDDEGLYDDDDDSVGDDDIDDDGYDNYHDNDIFFTLPSL